MLPYDLLHASHTVLLAQHLVCLCVCVFVMFFAALRRSCLSAAPYVVAVAAPALALRRQPVAACTGGAIPPHAALAIRPRAVNSSQTWAHKRQRPKSTDPPQVANISTKWQHKPKRIDSGVARVAPLALQPPGLDRPERDVTVARAAAPALRSPIR